ncbi:hypothetical protein QBC38DRAFT_534493 [Podospora fimiseda]|uniref:Cell surface protein n=1 Tax=Podospora fimiseda TaxID=252190 RepID=A0AAN7BWH7_9PEZI|nr:hypothetical protein QBC38DRAFT_534493 [Podospora fimiseda]
MSSIVNKIKEVVHSDKHSQPEGTSGPHNSRVANAADPRVDSDRDGSHHVGGRTAGHGEIGSTGLGHSTGTTGTHTSGTSGFGTHTSGTTEGAHGPHNSRVANTLDPRVDSDRDGSKTVGNTGTTGTTGFGGHNTHTTAGGLGHSTGTSGFGSSNTAGPHSSGVANKLDPRVDNNTGTTGGFGSNTHSSGLGHSTGTTGGFGSNTHSSGLGHSTGATGGFGSNTHSSGLGHSTGATGGLGSHSVGTSGPGPAPKTAGPHSSDMANKLDPTVDSDRDGSKTIGANRTYQSNNTSSGMINRDPTDAAQVPPSVLRRTLGDPILEHDDHDHQRDRRNSVLSHQERFSGI